MQEYSNDTAQGGPDGREVAGSPHTDSPLDRIESGASSTQDPFSNETTNGCSAGGEQHSLEPSSVSAPESPSTGQMECESDHPVANPIVRISGIKEIGRDSETFRITTWKPEFQVEKGLETSYKEIYERVESLRDPLNAIPLPTGTARFGSVVELFARLQDAIAEQAWVTAPTSALLSYWALSTWFSDALTFAPGLVIVGPAHEADLVLRALRNYCRYPLMLTRSDIVSLQKVSWESTPTLLFYDPSLTKQMASILTCSARRGYMVSVGNGFKDFFGPKALFLREDAPSDRTPQGGLRVNLQPSASRLQFDSPISGPTVQSLQNQLMMYRQKNLVNVYRSRFDAGELTSETRAIANALGACIIDSPQLQADIIKLLAPIENQRQADRSTCLEAVALEAMLHLAHAGKAHIYVGEIAKEVDRILEARGERLRFRAEKVGHVLKKLGLFTRRLGKAGKGLVMDSATITRLHQLAAVYGDVGLNQDEENLHCSLCIANE